MARPRKQGLVYFPLDVDIFGDPKLCAIRKEFGSKGELAVIKLLCAVYHDGYFIEWNKSVRMKLFSELDGVSEGLLDQIVKSLVKWEFFDQTLFDTANILTSHGIQIRYFSITKRRKKDPRQIAYLLEGVLTADGEVMDSDDKVMQQEATFLSAETPQNKTKPKDNAEACIPLSPSTATTAGVKDSGEKVDKGRYVGNIDTDLHTFDVPMTVDEAVPLLKRDRRWVLSMQQKWGLETRQVLNWLDTFVVDCDCREKQEHESMADVKQHFNDWLAKQSSLKSKPSKKAQAQANGNGSLTHQDYEKIWLSCVGELRKRASCERSDWAFAHLKFERYDVSDSRLLIQVPSADVYDYLENNCVKALSEVITRNFAPNAKLNYHLPPKQ